MRHGFLVNVKTCAFFQCGIQHGNPTEMKEMYGQNNLKSYPSSKPNTLCFRVVRTLLFSGSKPPQKTTNWPVLHPCDELRGEEKTTVDQSTNKYYQYLCRNSELPYLTGVFVDALTHQSRYPGTEIYFRTELQHCHPTPTHRNRKRYVSSATNRLRPICSRFWVSTAGRLRFKHHMTITEITVELNRSGAATSKWNSQRLDEGATILAAQNLKSGSAQELKKLFTPIIESGFPIVGIVPMAAVHPHGHGILVAG